MLRLTTAQGSNSKEKIQFEIQLQNRLNMRNMRQLLLFLTSLGVAIFTCRVSEAGIGEHPQFLEEGPILSLLKNQNERVYVSQKSENKYP